MSRSDVLSTIDVAWCVLASAGGAVVPEKPPLPQPPPCKPVLLAAKRPPYSLPDVSPLRNCSDGRVVSAAFAQDRFRRSTRLAPPGVWTADGGKAGTADDDDDDDGGGAAVDGIAGCDDLESTMGPPAYESAFKCHGDDDRSGKGFCVPIVSLEDFEYTFSHRSLVCATPRSASVALAVEPRRGAHCPGSTHTRGERETGADCVRPTGG